MRRRRRPLAVDLFLGALTGAGATWMMDQMTTLLLERQSEESKEGENEARGGKFAVEVVAEKAAKVAGRKLTKRQRGRLGMGIHWSVGVASGAIYGVLRNRIRHLGIGSGVAYGLALSLLVDEAALTVLGLSPPPDAFPWQAHARGLAGHVVFGAVLDAAFGAADLATWPTVQRS